MNAPTLLVGLGGTGSKIVEKVSQMVTGEQRNNIACAVLDTDVNELRVVKERNPFIYTVQTSTKQTVGEYLSIDSHACDEWFPINNILNGKTMTEGAGQVRSISRLAFETAMKAGKMEPLHEAIQSLFKVEEDKADQSVRVIIVSSLAGGTGSGLILPVGLYIRHYLETKFHKSSNITRGFFILPEVFFEVITGPAERNNLKANAYATLRELDAFLMKGDKTLPEKYKNTVVMEFPNVNSDTYEQYDIRPYDYCFLFDAQNAEGGKLNSFEQYLDHAANCIYSQSIGPMNKRSNSSEDNTIRNLVRQKGRNRYAGAGVSMLVYPAEDIMKYIAYNWAKNGVSDQWLAYDRIYQERCIENAEKREQGLAAPNPDSASFYAQQIENMKEHDDAFSKVLYSACVLHGADGISEKGKSWEIYVRTMLKKVESDVTKGTSVLVKAKEGVSNILASLSEKNDWREYSAAYEQEVKYRLQTEAYIDEASMSIAYTMFAPLKHGLPENRPDYRLETYMTSADGVFLHPNAVRYYLIKTYDLMRTNKLKFESERNALSKYFKSFEQDTFDNPETEERIETAADLGARKLTVFEKLSNRPTGDQEDMASKLREYADKIEDYKVKVAYCYVLDRGLIFVKKLIDSFEDFYKSLESKVSSIDRKISDITRKYVTSKGTTIRYVCASKECFEKILASKPFTGSTLSIDSALAKDIYFKIQEYATRKEQTGNNKFFEKLFDENILGYYVNSVRRIYGGDLDIDVISAIEREAEYRGVLEQDGDNDALISQYTRKIINDTRSLSCPFIESPMGEHKDSINSCTFHTSLVPEKGDESPKSQLIRKELLNFGSAPDEDIPRNMVMFYQSFYGLRANDLSKFAPPEKSMTYSRTGGEYFKSYFELISGIHPIAEMSKEISPHIDRRWHIVTKMPDLDDENQLKQEKDIYAAFFWGVAAKYIDFYEDISGHKVYKLKVDALKMTDDELYVSNGTKCDKLYEVLDAIAIYPELTQKLLDKVQLLIKEDLEDKATLEEGMLFSVLDNFLIQEPGLGANNIAATSIFDIPMLMRKSATFDNYFEEDAIQIIKVELEEIKKYLLRFCDPKELPEIMVEIIKTEFEKYLADVAVEKEVRSNIYREPLFDRTCSIIEEAVRELGMRKYAEQIKKSVTELRKSL